MTAAIPTPRLPLADALSVQRATAAARTVADRQRMDGDRVALAAIARLEGRA